MCVNEYVCVCVCVSANLFLSQTDCKNEMIRIEYNDFISQTVQIVASLFHYPSDAARFFLFLNVMRKRSYFFFVYVCDVRVCVCVFSHYYWRNFMTTFVFSPLFGSSHLFCCCFLFAFELQSLSYCFFFFLLWEARTRNESIFLTHELSDANQFNGNRKIEGENQKKGPTGQPTIRTNKTKCAARATHLTF